LVVVVGVAFVVEEATIVEGATVEDRGGSGTFTKPIVITTDKETRMITTGYFIFKKLSCFTIDCTTVIFQKVTQVL